MAEKKFDAQVNYGWGLSLNMTGKAPAVAKRIFDTYADALAYANDVNDSAIEGLVLSVVADTDATKNGAYFVQQAASAAVEADEEKGIEAVDAKEAILVKLGSADAAAGDTADALQAAKDYADAKVKALADGAVSANTYAIDVLNGDAQTDGSVKKAVADEKALREAAEKVITDRLDVIEGEAEGSVKKALADAKDYADNKVADLDATVSGASAHVSVEIVEEDGKLTTVTVVENDIASAAALTAETAAREAAVQGVQDAVDAIEADYLKAADKTELNNAITAEKTRAEGVESALSSRLAIIEGESEGSIKKALADAKAYADTKIDGLDSTKTGEGTFIDVTVDQENGVITSVTVAESDIASASTLTQEITDRENAIAALDAEVNSEDGDFVTVKVTEVDGVITAVNVTETNIASAQDLDDEVSARTAADAAINEKIGEITKGKTVVDMIADAQTAASDVDVKVDTLIGNDTNMSARAIVQDEVVKQLESENISDSFDTLKEIAEYLSSHPQSVTEMNTAIKNNADAISAETTARETAVQGIQEDVDVINETIGEVADGKTLVEMIEAAEATAIAAATVVDEDSEFINIEQIGEVGKTQTYTIKTQNIASISDLATEISRAQEAEQTNSNAINSIKSDYLKSSDKLELSQAIVSETEARILAISNLEFKNSLKLDGVVLSEELLNTLPDVQSGALYSVGPDSNDRYKLYAYVNNSWTYMGYLNSSSIDITQSLGQSLNLAISQKAVTDALTPIIMTLAEFDALVSNGTITDDDLTIRYIID